MAIKVSEDLMALEMNGRVVTTAREVGEGWWEIPYWPRTLRRDEAITALTITELLESGHLYSDPLVVSLRRELPE